MGAKAEDEGGKDDDQERGEEVYGSRQPHFTQPRIPAVSNWSRG